MSITTYIKKIHEDKDITYRDLAKEIGVSYPALLNYRSELVAFPSVKFLEKLANYLDKKPEEVLFEAYEEDYKDATDQLSVKYLLKKYCEGYGFKLNYNISSITGDSVIDGAYYKLRYTNSYTLVQSWESLCRQYWQQFESKLNIPYSRDCFVHIFPNEHTYHANVMAWASQRMAIIDNKSIRGYDILFDDAHSFEYGDCLRYLTDIKHVKISLILL